MPSLRSTLKEAEVEIRSWQVKGSGSKGWLATRQRAALQALKLLEDLMQVDHEPKAQTITDRDEQGKQYQLATCDLCGEQITRWEDVDRNFWKPWLDPATSKRCFGRVRS
jgi:hypothetical protein